jgi:hypothetical protein
MTYVKPQISKFKANKSSQVALTCYGGSTHERLLSESSRSYMLAFLSVLVLLATVHIFQSHVLNRTRNALNGFITFKLVGKSHNNKFGN